MSVDLVRLPEDLSFLLDDRRYDLRSPRSMEFDLDLDLDLDRLLDRDDLLGGVLDRLLALLLLDGDLERDRL